MTSTYDTELSGIASRLSESPLYAGIDPTTILTILSFVVPILLRGCFQNKPTEAMVRDAAVAAWDEGRGDYKRGPLNRAKRGVQRGSAGRKMTADQKDQMARELLDTARRGPLAGTVATAWKSPVQ